MFELALTVVGSITTHEEAVQGVDVCVCVRKAGLKADVSIRGDAPIEAFRLHRFWGNHP